MTVRNKNGALDAAIQYLTWALEEIAKFDHSEAALYARIALEELSRVRSAHREAEVRHDAGPASPMPKKQSDFAIKPRRQNS
jgi:hypothetical protein